MAAKISIYRGASYPVIYNHTDTAGVAVPLTGKTLYFTAKANKYDSDAADSTAIIKKTVATHVGIVGGVSLNAALGISGFTLTDLDTFVEPGTYYFTFLVEDNTTFQSDPPTVLGSLVVIAQQNNRQTVNG